MNPDDVLAVGAQHTSYALIHICTTRHGMNVYCKYIHVLLGLLSQTMIQWQQCDHSVSCLSAFPKKHNMTNFNMHTSCLKINKADKQNRNRTLGL